MFTVQILTKNNEKTIKKTLESISELEAKIVIGDLGSSDNTLEICSSFGAEIIKLKYEEDYSAARNRLIKEGLNFYIQPWETLVLGGDEICKLNCSSHVYVVNKGIVSKEIRFWSDARFENPIYETIIDENAKYSPGIVLVSGEEPDNREEIIKIAKKWISSKPTKSEPYYYLACAYLSKRMYKEFYSYANQYILMENKKANSSSIMLFYYMAQIELHTGMLKEAIKHVLTCLSFCPAFSEFWCLLGDIFYKQQKYDKAKSMYENALIIGKRRLQTDEYPIEIAKYENYPKFMMENINNIKEKMSLVIQKSKQ